MAKLPLNQEFHPDTPMKEINEILETQKAQLEEERLFQLYLKFIDMRPPQIAMEAAKDWLSYFNEHKA